MPSFRRIILFISLFGATLSWADPGEVLSVQLKRQAEHALKLQTVLKRNVYRSEAYQDYYTEQVPYQDTETYTVEVPYQDTEVYYEDVPYIERVPYTDYEDYYENEYRCHTVTEYKQECRTERLCQPVPGQEVCRVVEECGTNAHGQRICKERKVCERGPGQNECRDVQKCENVPVSREKCGYESVRKTRPVTRYRDETLYRNEQRTRTVTRCRQETRTRQVTRYREEQRCCVTKYRDVFDRQEVLNVQINFPQASLLQGKESEVIEVSWLGEAANGDVKIHAVQSIFGYKVKNKLENTQGISIDLELIPRYSNVDVGEKTISQVVLAITAHVNELSFVDAALFPRIQTEYEYEIREQDTNQLVTSGKAVAVQANKQKIALAQALAMDKDYQITLKVKRSGAVLEAGGVEFVKTAKHKFQRLDPRNHDASTFQLSVPQEVGDQILVKFQDKGDHAELDTQYVIQLLGQKDGEEYFRIQKDRTILNQAGVAQIEISQQGLDDQQDYIVHVMVQRESLKLEAPITFAKEQIFEKFVDLSALQNESLVGDIRIEGLNSDAVVLFSDTVPQVRGAQTSYKVQLWRKGGFLGTDEKIMAEKILDKESIVGQESGVIKLRAADLGVSQRDQDFYLAQGQWVKVVIEVTRSHSRLKQNVVFRKTQKMTL